MHAQRSDAVTNWRYLLPLGQQSEVCQLLLPGMAVSPGTGGRSRPKWMHGARETQPVTTPERLLVPVLPF